MPYWYLCNTVSITINHISTTFIHSLEVELASASIVQMTKRIGTKVFVFASGNNIAVVWCWPCTVAGIPVVVIASVCYLSETA